MVRQLRPRTLPAVNPRMSRTLSLPPSLPQSVRPSVCLSVCLCETMCLCIDCLYLALFALDYCLSCIFPSVTMAVAVSHMLLPEKPFEVVGCPQAGWVTVFVTCR